MVVVKDVGDISWQHVLKNQVSISSDDSEELSDSEIYRKRK